LELETPPGSLEFCISSSSFSLMAKDAYGSLYRAFKARAKGAIIMECIEYMGKRKKVGYIEARSLLYIKGIVKLV
jgi:hypothetical protein